MRRYAVLRGVPGLARARGLLSSESMSSGPATPPAVDPAAARVEVAELTPREAGGLSRAADVAAMAPAMPTTLIRPKDGPLPAAGPSWGIAAVGAEASAFDGTDVVVAILDTGIDAQHPAFQGVDLA